MNAAEVSRLLYLASERLTQVINDQEANTGRSDRDDRQLRDDIDHFRRQQDWSPAGFGGEQ